jgi:REJ domain
VLTFQFIPLPYQASFISFLFFHCLSGTEGWTSVASILVITNTPPVSGLFTVSPSSGLELLTVFSPIASLWYDDDLPMLYSFGFTATSGSLVMMPITQSAYATTLYPAGQDIDNYTVTAVLQVYDNTLAYTSAVSYVQVGTGAYTSSYMLSIGAYTALNCTVLLHVDLHYTILCCTTPCYADQIFLHSPRHTAALHRTVSHHSASYCRLS